MGAAFGTSQRPIPGTEQAVKKLGVPSLHSLGRMPRACLFTETYPVGALCSWPTADGPLVLRIFRRIARIPTCMGNDSVPTRQPLTQQGTGFYAFLGSYVSWSE